MPDPIYIEIEENDNCGYMPMQVYEAQGEPVPIRRVRLFPSDRPHGVYEVTGWSSEDDGTPTPAMYVPVSESGQAAAHLVCGDDWGIRLKPADSGEDWDIDSPDQWGEPYLVLTEASEILLDG